MRCDGLNSPNALMIDIAGSLLLEEFSDLADLCLARSGIEEEVAQLARVGLNVDGALGDPWVALEDEDLVLGPTFLLEGMHCGVAVRSCESTVSSCVVSSFSCRETESLGVLRLCLRDRIRGRWRGGDKLEGSELRASWTDVACEKRLL